MKLFWNNEKLFLQKIDNSDTHAILNSLFSTLKREVNLLDTSIFTTLGNFMQIEHADANNFMQIEHADANNFIKIEHAGANNFIKIEHADANNTLGVIGIITTVTTQNILKDDLKQRIYSFTHGNIGLKWINPFHANVLFLYPLKTPENQRFSDVFRGYRNRTLT